MPCFKCPCNHEQAALPLCANSFWMMSGHRKTAGGLLWESVKSKRKERKNIQIKMAKFLLLNCHYSKALSCIWREQRETLEFCDLHRNLL